MNNTWWQEFVRFFLQGITLNRLIYMLIIFVLLIFITPASIKDWINSSSPEIFSSYWLYFVFFLVSYVIAQLISFLTVFTKRRFRNLIECPNRAAILNTLTHDEIDLLKHIVRSGEIVELPTQNETVKGLIRKGIIAYYDYPDAPMVFTGDEKQLFKLTNYYKNILKFVDI
ncbi:super-infection exclusion protein B [Arsenophonus nasoniae]|nr:super-infection exclusion protein B [Arsenophonus nasoniae]QBY43825.1 Super-infection exclusion protein B [Arsenophonus nasoniae]QBY45397.1 Super-infection exclusion protein B [Arsenophonus nasoniae]WGM05546.1 super-infection exclusion protein B [Arsenophonus nasoniae]WGM10559.1 super-infection exclusion protein B [Arsenophonus nasoniae]WGM15265.1 super-infection exclusion protein B [Arsenophonus nasoniae]